MRAEIIDLHERTKLQGEINDLLLFSNEKEEYAGLARQIIKNKARLISKYAQDNLPQDLQDFLDEKIKEASEANDWGW
jgi:hypothetical protein